LPELDSTKRYDLFINLRDNNNYQYNKSLIVSVVEKPNGYTKVDTLEYQMAEPDGLLGNGLQTYIKSKLFFKENVKFRKYKVHIKQAVREKRSLE
jgi:gliding motility-associated lipoprotein GldH